MLVFIVSTYNCLTSSDTRYPIIVTVTSPDTASTVSGWGSQSTVLISAVSRTSPNQQKEGGVKEYAIVNKGTLNRATLSQLSYNLDITVVGITRRELE